MQPASSQQHGRRRPSERRPTPRTSDRQAERLRDRDRRATDFKMVDNFFRRNSVRERGTARAGAKAVIWRGMQGCCIPERMLARSSAAQPASRRPEREATEPRATERATDRLRDRENDRTNNKRCSALGERKRVKPREHSRHGRRPARASEQRATRPAGGERPSADRRDRPERRGRRLPTQCE